MDIYRNAKFHRKRTDRHLGSFLIGRHGSLKIDCAELLLVEYSEITEIKKN